MYTYSAMTSNTVTVGNWILYQRFSASTQFFLVPNVQTYINIYSMIFLLGSISLILLLLISLKNVKKISLIFLILALISIFITSKGQGLIGDGLALKIFSLPIINIFRSPDKTFVFLPFFFIALIYVGIHESYNHVSAGLPNSVKLLPKLRRSFRLHFRKVVLACFLLIIISAYPFFVGGLQTQYSVAFNQGQNYQTAGYSYLVHVPNDYYSAANLLSQDTKLNRILYLPYSVINSVGWVNYPKWKAVGVDPTDQVFTKPIIQANFANFPYGQLWNSENVTDSNWIVQIMSLYNVQYLVYHKDVDPVFVNQTQDKIDFLQQEGYISLIKSYDNFDLYNLSSSFFRPQIYPTSTMTIVNGSWPNMIPLLNPTNLTSNTVFFLSTQMTNSQLQSLSNYESVTSNENTSPQIIFQQVNPTNYQVRVQNASQPFFLVFSESYDPGWKAYIKQGDEQFGTIVGNYENMGVEEAKSTSNFNPTDISYLLGNPLSESDHFMVNGYSNVWYIDPSQIGKNQNGTFDITLFYQPQGLYYLGLTVSGVITVGCLVYLIFSLAAIHPFKKPFKLHIARKVKYNQDNQDPVRICASLTHRND